jgi:hypothetical protein
MRPLPLVAKGRLLAKEAPPVDDVEAPSVESGVAAILAADVACYGSLFPRPRCDWNSIVSEHVQRGNERIEPAPASSTFRCG